MQKAPINDDEIERLDAVHRLNILDTPPEERFDILTKEAVARLHVPISTISIIDAKREWFKSCQGLDATEGPRAISFCGHALLDDNVLIVPDTLKDERFADNPMVTGAPFIRAYCGVPILDNQTKKPIGVFCVKDTKPHEFSLSDVRTLADLASQAEKAINA